MRYHLSRPSLQGSNPMSRPDLLPFRNFHRGFFLSKSGLVLKNLNELVVSGKRLWMCLRPFLIILAVVARPSMPLLSGVCAPCSGCLSFVRLFQDFLSQIDHPFSPQKNQPKTQQPETHAKPSETARGREWGAVGKLSAPAHDWFQKARILRICWNHLIKREDVARKGAQHLRPCIYAPSPSRSRLCMPFIFSTFAMSSTNSRPTVFNNSPIYMEQRTSEDHARVRSLGGVPEVELFKSTCSVMVVGEGRTPNPGRLQVSIISYVSGCRRLISATESPAKRVNHISVGLASRSDEEVSADWLGQSLWEYQLLGRQWILTWICRIRRSTNINSSSPIPLSLPKIPPRRLPVPPTCLPPPKRSQPGTRIAK